MGGCVHQHDGVGSDFGVVGLQEVLDRRVEILFWRRLNDDYLGRRRRLRLGNLKWLERCLQRRRRELEVD